MTRLKRHMIFEMSKKDLSFLDTSRTAPLIADSC